MEGTFDELHKVEIRPNNAMVFQHLLSAMVSADGVRSQNSNEVMSAASFKAVGALSSVRLGWFSWETKKYEPVGHSGRAG
jgi:hypothetical protein